MLFGAEINNIFSMISGNARKNPNTGNTILATITKNRTNGDKITPSVFRVIFSAAHFNLLIGFLLFTPAGA